MIHDFLEPQKFPYSLRDIGTILAAIIALILMWWLAYA